MGEETFHNNYKRSRDRFLSSNPGADDEGDIQTASKKYRHADRPEPLVLYRYKSEGSTGISQFIAKVDFCDKEWLRYPPLKRAGTPLCPGSTRDSVYLLEHTEDNILVMNYLVPQKMQWESIATASAITCEIKSEMVSCTASEQTICVVINGTGVAPLFVSVWVFDATIFRWEAIRVPEEMAASLCRYSVGCDPDGLIVFRKENMNVGWVFDIRNRIWRGRGLCSGLLQYRGVPSFINFSESDSRILYVMETVQPGRLRVEVSSARWPWTVALSDSDSARIVWKVFAQPVCSGEYVNVKLFGSRLSSCREGFCWDELVLPEDFALFPLDSGVLYRFELLPQPDKLFLTYRKRTV